MRDTNESFESQPVDHTSEPYSKHAAVKPAAEISMLKPLGHANTTLTFLLGYGSSWYGRFLGLGVGALAMMAAVFVSAIVIGINDRLPGVEIAVYQSTEIYREPSIGFDLFSAPIPRSRPSAVEPVRFHTRTKAPGPEIVRVTASKTRRESRSSPRLGIRKFVPTTLVIYAENGVIKRRIEPWLRVASNDRLQVPRYSRD
jgi:hypothetical protein